MQNVSHENGSDLLENEMAYCYPLSFWFRNLVFQFSFDNVFFFTKVWHIFSLNYYKLRGHESQKRRWNFCV